jgi:3-oxoacyl-[acyl-carrier-protein] synthase-1
MPRPLAIVSSGMSTGVGLSAPASCAAIRAGITSFHETRFIDQSGQWILGAEVPLAEPLRGVDKLVHLAVSSIREALAGVDGRQVPDILLLLGVAEPARPGRLADLDEAILDRVQEELGFRFHKESRLIAQGRMSGITAIQVARSAIFDAGFPFCVIAGVDSYLVGPMLVAFEARHRLLTSENADGFIPGEAAATVLVGRADGATKISVWGLGSGSEPAPIGSGEPLRAEGLVNAFRTALQDAGVGWENLDYRLTDLNGEQYFFREAALALTRSLRIRKEVFDLWHTADCIGEIGAAAVPCALAVAHDAAMKDYAPGPGVMCHFSSDGPERAAVVLQAA